TGLARKAERTDVGGRVARAPPSIVSAAMRTHPQPCASRAWFLIPAILAAGCASGPRHISPGETSMESKQKQQAVEFLKSIETGDTRALAYAGRYKQHNLAVPDGVDGLGAVLSQLPKGTARVNTARAFQDGDFVFTHTDYDFFGPKIGFDIFRFENGRIAEHWDNLQEKPAQPNPSGRTMID